MAEKEIGKVLHCYDHVMAAVVALTDDLKVGDKVKFIHQDHEFEQVVDSMEIEHQRIESAKAGDEVAIHTNEKTHEHAKVFKIE